MKRSNYIAVLNTSAFTGIGLVNIEYSMDQYAVYEIFNGNSAISKGKVKVRYDNTGNPYIRIKGQSYYMGQFMRIS